MWTSPELTPLAAFAGPRDEKSAPADRAAPANPKVFRKPRRRFTISWFGSTPSFVSPDSSEEIICAAGGLSLRMINRPFLSMGGFPTSRSHTAAQTLALRKYSSRSHRRFDYPRLAGVGEAARARAARRPQVGRKCRRKGPDPAPRIERY